MKRPFGLFAFMFSTTALLFAMPACDPDDDEFRSIPFDPPEETCDCLCLEEAPILEEDPSTPDGPPGHSGSHGGGGRGQGQGKGSTKDQREPADPTR